MVKEVENIDSSVCQASMPELPVGGGWVGVASFIYLFGGGFFPRLSTQDVFFYTQRKLFSLYFIFFFSPTSAAFSEACRTSVTRAQTKL